MLSLQWELDAKDATPKNTPDFKLTAKRGFNSTDRLVLQDKKDKTSDLLFTSVIKAKIKTPSVPDRPH